MEGGAAPHAVFSCQAGKRPMDMATVKSQRILTKSAKDYARNCSRFAGFEPLPG